ncbi:hypothetical protein [Salipaludibacillus sp. CF4.18]|uniref:hypothetical protein n=1 Tax=Salipaludibacillus sp. CF4.18 TaxID=3373081 RepID=UPI003EE62AA3
MQYDWPGNVRELENVLERIMLTTDEEMIYPEHLPATIHKNSPYFITHSTPMIEQSIEEEHNLKRVMEQGQERLLTKAYKRCKTTYEMASYLGISQPSVARKLKEFSINNHKEKR